MQLLLCSGSDLPGMWAFHALRGGALPSLELVTIESLADCSDWEHRVGASGDRISFRLPDGRTIDDSQIEGVLNRLVFPPQELISRAVPADRDYVQQEMTALYLSWLYGLSCPVLNRPTPQGLAGRWRHASEWALAAHRAGFDVPVYEQTESGPADRGGVSFAGPGESVTQVVVLDGEVFGSVLPERIRDSCRELADICEMGLLGIDLLFSLIGGWSFASATPLPDLEVGGHPLIARLAQALGAHSETDSRLKEADS